MNIVSGPAHQESPYVAKWLEHPAGIWIAMGSIPVGTFLCPTLMKNKHFIFHDQCTL